MHSIEKLPNHLIDQIKAGEVVERPASVIKELVENAIDAKATKIEIEILDGGKQLIRVSDNGRGIAAAQLELALERHATSKIKAFDDLLSITSFGFRGEALPSIASISHFTIKSKPENQLLGQEITVQNGAKLLQKEVPLPTGTVIQVKDLFAVVPARLKFLKSTATEFYHIHDHLMATALSHYKIAFHLVHNSKTVFRYKEKNTLAERFADMVGIESKKYVPLNYERGSVQVHGFAVLPQEAENIASYFMIFVNGRYVKDKAIRAGVLQGYQGLLLKGLTPSVVLFLTVPTAWIDVNVHPAKTEIRINDAAAIQEYVAIAIQDALKETLQEASSIPTEVITHSREKLTNSPYTPPASTPEVAHSVSKPIVQSFTQRFGASAKYEPPAQRFEHVAQLKTSKESLAPIPLFNETPATTTHFKYLGQFANCYLIMQTKQELWFVDQHAFHERILFEELTLAHQKNKTASKQALLTPLILPHNLERTRLADLSSVYLSQVGFDVEVLSNGTLAIHSHPAFLSVQKVPGVFQEILNSSNAHENNNTLSSEETLREQVKLFHLFFATVACHSAVRAGDPLNEELVTRLLQRSQNVDFYAHCPHGRPVIRKFFEKEVASWFERT